MRSIKTYMIVSFCAIAALSITALAAIISQKISQNITGQAEKIAAETATRTYETLHLPHQAFDVLIKEDIQRSIGELCQNPVVMTDVEADRLSALDAELAAAAKKNAFDVALLLNLKGQLQASFPKNLDEFAVQTYFQSWTFAPEILRLAEHAEETTSQIIESFMRHDSAGLQTLGLHAFDIDGKGALSFVAASILRNDFQEPLAICVIGKLLHGEHTPLQRLHAMAGYASAIFLDNMPVAYTGLSAAADASAFALAPALYAEIIQSPEHLDREITIANTRYLASCASLNSFDHKPLGVLCFGFPSSPIVEAQQKILLSGMESKRDIQAWIWGMGLLIATLFAAASWGIASMIVKPIRMLSLQAQRLAKGDLTEDIHIVSHGEIGELSESLNSMVFAFREISATSQSIATGNLHHKVTPRSEQDILGHALQKMSNYLNDMASMAETVAQGDLTIRHFPRSKDDVFGGSIQAMTEGLRALISQIKQSVNQIRATEAEIVTLVNQNINLVNHIHQSIQEMTSHIDKTGESVSVVSHNMEALFSFVTDTVNSVSLMATSITQIASNTTSLTQHTHDVMALIEQSSHSLEEIVERTDRSQEFAHSVIEDAFEGQEAVEQVMRSMEKIQETMTIAVNAISQFAHRSREIDTILDVIRDITDRTSLLALNASIIAAQAGDRGRGFAVVAEEMKSLANGVNTSTKDIALILKSVQQEASKVGQTVHDGAANVAHGIQRTQAAQKALQKIHESSQHSSSEVTMIAEALHHLMANIHQIFLAIEGVNAMTQQITAATITQEGDTSDIYTAITNINDMASQVQQMARSQLDAVRQAITRANIVNTLIDRNLESSQHIDQTAKELTSQAAVLLRSVDRFRLSAEEGRTRLMTANNN